MNYSSNYCLKRQMQHCQPSTHLAFMQAEGMQHGFNGSDGRQHIAIADEAQVADAEHFAFEVVLTAG
jgi:hypothetical protein